MKGGRAVGRRQVRLAIAPRRLPAGVRSPKHGQAEPPSKELWGPPRWAASGLWGPPCPGPCHCRRNDGRLRRPSGHTLSGKLLRPREPSACAWLSPEPPQWSPWRSFGELGADALPVSPLPSRVVLWAALPGRRAQQSSPEASALPRCPLRSRLRGSAGSSPGQVSPPVPAPRRVSPPDTRVRPVTYLLTSRERLTRFP